MRTHFISRLALLIVAGFLVVASQVWTGATSQWLFAAGGAVMILGAFADSIRDNSVQRALDGLIALLGAWTVIETFIFDGTNLTWWSFASAVALAALCVVGLIAHESNTERVVHELSVTTGRTRTPATAS